MKRNKKLLVMLKFSLLFLVVFLFKSSFSCEGLIYENMFSFSDVNDTLDTYCLDCNNAEYKIFLHEEIYRVDKEIDSIVDNLTTDKTKIRSLNYLKNYFDSGNNHEFIAKFVSRAKLFRKFTTDEYTKCFFGGTHYGIAYGMQYLSISYEIIKYLKSDYGEVEFVFTVRIIQELLL